MAAWKMSFANWAGAVVGAGLGGACSLLVVPIVYILLDLQVLHPDGAAALPFLLVFVWPLCMLPVAGLIGAIMGIGATVGVHFVHRRLEGKSILIRAVRVVAESVLLTVAVALVVLIVAVAVVVLILVLR
jgi:hypothetical protein